MKSNLKLMSVLSLVVMAAFASGCGKGEPGKDGKDAVVGQGSGGGVVSTINCKGVIPNTATYFGLRGLKIKYNAVLTENDDVYASASVTDEEFSFSATQFYAAGNAASGSALVQIGADYVGSANGGSWDVELDRSTMKVKVQYFDTDGNYLTQFNPVACVVENF